MTEPFVGEIQVFGFSFAPLNWAFAAGQTLPIRQSTTLFSLYGTTFGGNGTVTFQLPNFAGRQACGAGQGPGITQRDIGEPFGNYAVSLSSAETPMHNHIFSDYQPTEGLAATPDANSAIAYSAGGTFNAFAAPGTTVSLNPNAIGVSGNGAPHQNSQPCLGLSYCVALAGVFPQFP
jgi:microcystin-dependent protein